MLHSSDIGQVLDILEVTSHGLVEPVETSVFNELSDDFEGFLIPPLVHLGHVDVVNEYSHEFSLGRSKVLTHLKVAFDFHVGLEGQGR